MVLSESDAYFAYFIRAPFGNEVQVPNWPPPENGDLGEAKCVKQSTCRQSLPARSKFSFFFSTCVFNTIGVVKQIQLGVLLSILRGQTVSTSFFSITERQLRRVVCVRFLLKLHCNYEGDLALKESNLPFVPARPSGFGWLCAKSPRVFVYRAGSRAKRRSPSPGLCRPLALCGTYRWCRCCCGHSHRSGDNLKSSKRITPSAACRCLPLPTEAGPAQTAWFGWGICRRTVGLMTQTPSASRSHGPRASSVTSSGRSCSICFKSIDSALPGTYRN